MIAFRVDREEKAMIDKLSKTIVRTQSATIRFAIERLNEEVKSIPREDAVMLGRRE